MLPINLAYKDRLYNTPQVASQTINAFEGYTHDEVMTEVGCPLNISSKGLLT